MHQRSYCPSHPLIFKNSGSTVDSADHRMEVCLMSGLGATVQTKVRLLRFSPETWVGGVPGHAHHLAVLLEMLGLSTVRLGACPKV